MDQTPKEAVSVPPERAALEAHLGSQALGLLQRQGMIRQLMKALLVEQAVAHIPISTEDRAQASAEWRKRLGIDSPDALAKVAAINGIRSADLEWQMLLSRLRAQHCRDAYGHLAESTFLKEKDRLDQVVYSLLRVKDQHLAQELYFRLEAGEVSFAELAETYSEGPERENRGIVGPKPLNSAHPRLAELLRTAQSGVVQAPIPVSDVWLITRLEQIIPAAFNDAVAQQICEKLFEDWLDQQASAILAGNSTPV